MNFKFFVLRIFSRLVNFIQNNFIVGALSDCNIYLPILNVYLKLGDTLSEYSEYRRLIDFHNVFHKWVLRDRYFNIICRNHNWTLCILVCNNVYKVSAVNAKLFASLINSDKIHVYQVKSYCIIICKLL